MLENCFTCLRAVLYLSVRYACSDTEFRYYRIFGFYFNPSSSKNSRIRASDAPISIIEVKNWKTCPYVRWAPIENAAVLRLFSGWYFISPNKVTLS